MFSKIFIYFIWKEKSSILFELVRGFFYQKQKIYITIFISREFDYKTKISITFWKGKPFDMETIY
jgi:hypothetical protein